MVIQRQPRNVVPRLSASVPGAQVYKVQTGDSWTTVARDHGLDPPALIFANFRTVNPAEVNWYLRHYVGCTHPSPDGHNWRFDSSDRPGLISIPTTGAVHFRVPMVSQGPSPICWIACIAMIASFKGRASLGTGSFTGGFDVSESSVPSTWGSGGPNFYDRLRALGFVTENPFPNKTPDASYIQRILHEHGPWMLAFYTSDLMGPRFPANSEHAIVITGIDTDTNRVWYNNPWGAADQVTTVGAVLIAMERMMARGMRSVGYMP
jgi:hypothetical protein